jgi:hypothetical protein
MMRLRLQIASSPFGDASRLACQLMSALQSVEEWNCFSPMVQGLVVTYREAYAE